MMMEAISLYDDRGEIHTTIRGDAVAIQTTIDNTTDQWVDGDWFGLPKYVSNGEVLDRPVNPATASGMTLLNVPVPATLLIGREIYDVTESTVELEFNLPGTYTVKVIAWPYLDKEFTIENPAP